MNRRAQFLEVLGIPAEWVPRRLAEASVEVETKVEVATVAVAEVEVEVAMPAPAAPPRSVVIEALSPQPAVQDEAALARDAAIAAMDWAALEAA
ncbi:uracil-DNA glycosylase, partial [Burkholderia sp. SIMBA_019]